MLTPGKAQVHIGSDVNWTSWADWHTFLTRTLEWPVSHLGLLKDRDDILGLFEDSSHLNCRALVVNDQRFSGRLRNELTKTAAGTNASFLIIGKPLKYSVLRIGSSNTNCIDASSRLGLLLRPQSDSLVKSLASFRDEDQARKIFNACHNAIYFDTAKDPAACFDLIALVIAAKIYDERFNAPHYKFILLDGEAVDATVRRFNTLLLIARDWLASGRGDIEQSTLHRLSSGTVIKLISTLQTFSLASVAGSPESTDLLGIVYERFVGATFRGELGSYFTPKTIADFMVRIIDARRGRICDPSCGSGGLLLAAQRYATSEAADTSDELLKTAADDTLVLHGNDLNPRMVEAAKLNFLMHDLSPTSIFSGNGMLIDRTIAVDAMANGSLPARHFIHAPGHFDFVIANPPFAGHETDPDVLSRLMCARNAKGGVRAVNRTLAFLELIIGILKPGGSAAVVVPTSILNAEDVAFKRFRDLALSHIELVAIVGLPEKAFVHTDCGVHGALLFFRRTLKPSINYNVYLDWAEHLGYDRLGKPTKTNDFVSILKKFRSSPWPTKNTVNIKELVDQQRWDPSWLRSMQNSSSTNNDLLIPLTDICEIRPARWSRRQIVDEQLYRYFEVSDADMHTGEVLAVRETSGYELAKKGRIRNRVLKGDILLPNHRDSLIASSAQNGRSVVIVGDSLDGVLTTDRFLVLRPKIHPQALAWILNSAPLRKQLVARCRGAASLDIRESVLREVKVPRALLTESSVESIRVPALQLVEARKREEELYQQVMTTIENMFKDICI